MSTTEVLQRGGADLQSTDERARAAVKAFHRMQPSLSAYARALTGRSDVQVVVSPNSNGHTNGKKIFYRPPLALGDNTPHQRKLCDERDPETLEQLCPACAIREQVLIVIYHEIGHIAHGSFEPMTENERAEALKYGLSLVDKKYAAAVMDRVQRAPLAVKESYIGMAGLISPFLPGIVNALEDARVNRDSMTARKGTRIMFQVDTMRVLREGFENKMPDGSIQRVFWRDRPLNAQMVCALYARSAGYPMEEHFVPEVVAALDDSKIKGILRDFSTVRNAKGVYALSIALLVRLRELGFYQHHTDPQVEDEPEPEQDQQDDESQDEEQKEDEQDDDGQDSEDGDDEGDAGAGGSMGDPDDAEGSAEQGAAGGDESGDPTGDPEESEGSGSSPGQDGGEAGTEPEEGEGGGSDDSSDRGEDQPAGDDTDGDAGSGGDSDSSGEGSSEESSERSDDGHSTSGDGGSPEDQDVGDRGDSDDSEPAEASGNGSQGGELDEVDEGEGNDPSEATSDGTGTGEGTPESGSDEQVGNGEVEGGTETSPGAGSDHDTSEAGSDVQGLESDEDMDPASMGELESNPVHDLVGDDGTGDDSGDPRPEETDDVPGSSLDERGDDERSKPERDKGTDPEVIDTGADEGLGGVEVIEDSAFDRLPMGTPEEVNEVIHEVAHPEDRPDHVKEEASGEKEMDRAIVQGLYFETPSRNIFGAREHYYGQPIMVGEHNMSQGWDHSGLSMWGYNRKQLGVEGDFSCDEKTLGPALLRMRVAFADNKRGHEVRNRKAGKVDARVLGKRAHAGDERLFKKRMIPGKKDYFVLIGIDISGSTIGVNIVLAKRAAMAQAELCARMGIKFAVFAHSGNYHDPDQGRIEGMDMDIYHIKDPDEPWTENIKQRLTELGPASVNLDGHTFEYYRKILDNRTETHRVILYYTDGKMPAENAAEELVILQREIKICRQKKYVLMGVGIHTDSPEAHGLETVKVTSDADLVKVVQRLEKRLLEIT